ncbi:echinoidin-like [Diadema antillarum]|uniref:echinoidin-like n=1 Tax=Diadema antillarum TaxID=105358 RepID=UPI003A87B3E8
MANLKSVLFGGLAITAALLVTLPPSSEASACGCPPFWTPFGGNCYRFFTFKNVTWDAAEMHCRGFSVPCSETRTLLNLGHLTSIHSQEEHDFLTVLYETTRNKRVATRVWIGLTDQDVEGAWRWSDGSDVTFTSWGSSQPNSHGGNQDCASFALKTDIGYNWNDLDCGIENEFTVESFICKLPRW